MRLENIVHLVKLTYITIDERLLNLAGESTTNRRNGRHKRHTPVEHLASFGHQHRLRLHLLVQSHDMIHIRARRACVVRKLCRFLISGCGYAQILECVGAIRVVPALLCGVRPYLRSCFVDAGRLSLICVLNALKHVGYFALCRGKLGLPRSGR